MTVGPSDFPHAIPPLPGLADSLGGTVRVLHDARHAYYATLPTLGSKCKRAKVRRANRVMSGGPGACRGLMWLQRRSRQQSAGRKAVTESPSHTAAGLSG